MKGWGDWQEDPSESTGERRKPKAPTNQKLVAPSREPPGQRTAAFKEARDAAPPGTEHRQEFRPVMSREARKMIRLRIKRSGLDTAEFVSRLHQEDLDGVRPPPKATPTTGNGAPKANPSVRLKMMLPASIHRSIMQRVVDLDFATSGDYLIALFNAAYPST